MTTLIAGIARRWRTSGKHHQSSRVWSLWRGSRLRIAALLWFGFGIMFVVVVGTNAMSIWTMQRLGHVLDDVVDISEPLSVAAFEMEINTIGAGMGVLNYLHNPDPVHRQRFHNDQADFARFYRHFVGLLDGTRHTALGERLGTLSTRFSVLAEALLQAKDMEVAQLDRLIRTWAKLERQTDKDHFFGVNLTGEQLQHFKTPRHGLDETIAAMSHTFVAPIGAGEDDDVTLSGDNVQSLRNMFNELKKRAVTQDSRARIEQFSSDFDAAFAYFKEVQDLRRSMSVGLAEFNALRTRLEDLLDEEIQVFTRNKVLSDRDQALGGIEVSELNWDCLA